MLEGYGKLAERERSSLTLLPGQVKTGLRMDAELLFSPVAPARPCPSHELSRFGSRMCSLLRIPRKMWGRMKVGQVLSLNNRGDSEVDKSPSDYQQGQILEMRASSYSHSREAIS